ncbi:MAG: PSD1 and planctomycete cytochrome C domain-containing protein [Planctomycetota bacterium]|nr:PSD1 and planctomycete cytochrome C domain-containing protein [Planctomycetota bacterium]MDA0918097.1 PSD1 and planctomycete cytochrome C domain-containing protein [Planctomycetota bacterium]MDA1158173.1 PSD1 and planctomycete cytochrome C domain-containing protein [Planctomycetota bacterium]
MNKHVPICMVVIAFAVQNASAAEAKIDFNRDIRPILSDNCYACHGPDESHREGGFRLDRKDSAFGKTDSDSVVIVPGKPDASELIARIVTDDVDLRMPPADSTKSLSKDQIDLLKRWVEQGATWQEHWAFMPPVKREPPTVSRADWVRNPIDSFILKRLDDEGLKPSPTASKESLIRRVTLDLTGLPPTLDEVDAFLNDHSEDAYAKVVDRLLRSKRYGEHMARYWLDAARYGDTHGLHLDNYREMWPYRDWVVRAFNQNMPYDQFTIEQLAGDLLENPSEDQLVATGFNRCHVTTSEGGSIAEEVHIRNVVDRVVTTGTVFLGMTFDCTRCHDHKYDPFTQRDFYSMSAFFNSIDGNPLDGNKKDPAPVIKVLTSEEKGRIAELNQKAADLRDEIRQQVADYKYVEPETPTEAKLPEPTEFVWIEDSVPEGGRAQGGWEFVTKPKPVFSGEKSSTRTATGLSQHFFDQAKTPLKIADGDVFFCYVYLDEKNPPKEIMLQFNDGSWDHRAYWGSDSIDWGKKDSPSRFSKGELPDAGKWIRLEVPVAEVGLKAGAMINGWAFTQFDGTVFWDKAGIVSKADQTPIYDSLLVWERDQIAAKAASLPADIKAVVMLDPAKRNDAQQKQLRDYFVENVCSTTRSLFDPLHKSIADVEKKVADTQNAAATTLVFREKKEPKPAHILNRGEYDQKKDEVPRAVPAILPPLPEGAPTNRLGLAQWLTSREHPLMARVTVNRFWQQFFGTGLVKTSEDFGSQGEPASHPELLDWLAVQFQDDGWDVQKTLRRMVMSATYRQAAVVRGSVERDPENRLLSRGPRFRLDAEVLRDQALFVSGLLVEKLGGPSVKPPQPDGLWFAVGYSGSNTVRFTADTGADKVHRRTLYTFLKRTAPAPQMSIIDAPSREACTVRRERTNTPLQALLLLNDPQYVECARGLAGRVLREGGQTAESRAVYLLRLCTGRKPQGDEVSELVSAVVDLQSVYAKDEAAAAKLVAAGSPGTDVSVPTSELAAWTIGANLVLNLDEVLTKN